MKVGIISDTHGDGGAWEQALATCFQGVDLIIHAGDVLYHGPGNPIISRYAPKNLVELLHRSPVPLLVARGNCDAEVDVTVLKLAFSEQVVFQMGGYRIIAQHGHRLQAGEAATLAAYHRADLWISGHTHVPELVARGGIIFVNPGSPSLPRTGPMGRKKTVAVADEHSVRLLDLSTGEILKEITWLAAKSKTRD